MTPEDVRAAAERLTQFHQRFAPLFGKDEAQNHAYVYVKGLMTCPDRKSIEPIALLVGDGRVSALQKFINIAPWDHDDIQAEIQEVFTEELAPTATADAVGTVGVIDESGFAKKGEHSAGVDRQYNGRLGKEDNCQVGVYLIGVAPGGSALLDHQLYLPESWCEDNEACRARRAKAHIPESIVFQTKPEIAGAMVRRTEIAGLVALDWITADEEYGRNGDFLDELETLGKRYVVEVPVNTTVWTEDPAGCIPPYGGKGRVPTKPSRDSVKSVKEVAASWERTAWRQLCVGQGAKGPLCYEFAAVRVWAVRHGEAGRPIWLLVRRSLEEKPEIKYYVSNARRDDPAGGAGPSGLQPAQGRGVFRGRQELSGDGAVRDAVVDRLAPSHESGGSGSSVHHADPAGSAKKNAGADAGSGGSTALECDRGAEAEHRSRD